MVRGQITTHLRFFFLNGRMEYLGRGEAKDFIYFDAARKSFSYVFFFAEMLKEIKGWEKITIEVWD